MQLLCSKSQRGIRSLVCDHSGIVIAETVYRCMICAEIFDVLDDIQKHYQLEHFEEEIRPNTRNPYYNCPEEIDYENDGFDNGHLTSQLVDVNQKVKYKTSLICRDNQDYALNQYTHFANENYFSKPINLPNCNTAKGGSVTCEVCGLTKFYSHISRRYGVFSCESCAKFFYRYSQKPVQYTCTGNNKCPLNIDLPGARCKSCLLEACLKKYILDPKKHHKIFKKDSNINDISHVDSDGDHPVDNGVDVKLDILNDAKPKTCSNKMTNTKGQSLLAKSASLSSASLDENSPSPIDLKKGHKKYILSTSAKKRKQEENVDNVKIRRVACKQCTGCLAEDCGKCLYCLDKPKFGGNDVKKQKCLRRRCNLLQ